MKSQAGLVFLFFLASVSAQHNPCEGHSLLFVNDFASCSRYFVCINNVPHPFECPAGFHFDQASQACVFVGGAAECDRCPAEGVITIGVPDSCTDYRLCINGNSMERECAPGTLFDWRSSQCARAETVSCDYLRCPLTGTKVVADPQSCYHYLVCVEGEELARRQCADGLRFDPELGSCSRSENVICVARAGIAFSPYFNDIEDIPTVPIVTSVPTAPTMGTRAPIPPVHPGPPMVPDQPPQLPPQNPPQTPPQSPEVPPAFPPGTIVREWPTGPVTCPPSGHFYFGHHISCAFFQVCSHGRLHWVNCPVGQRWSTVFGRCEFPDRSNCPHAR